jgi:hypothetical protein
LVVYQNLHIPQTSKKPEIVLTKSMTIKLLKDFQPCYSKDQGIANEECEVKKTGTTITRPKVPIW